MNTIISIFRNLCISYANRKNNVQVISESAFNRLVDHTKPVIVINNL
jgi:hypothetical protein